jgi:hypothetical protein
VTRYDEVRGLALRLLAGETIDVTDEHGRVWRGEVSTLSLVQPGTGAVGPVLEGVARLDVSRGLPSLQQDWIAPRCGGVQTHLRAPKSA